jgi:hypothetical protein
MEALIAMAESLAPLLLAEGVSCPDAERVLRSVCIHEAARAEQARGNRPNASRLALLTGVDRHVVARFLRLAPNTDPTKLQTHRHRLNRILTQWYSDPDYSEGGKPRALEVRAGERRRSFWSLSKTYAKDAYPPLILGELVKVGAVERLRDGRVRPRARTYKAMELDEQAVHDIGRRVRDLTRTMMHNMSSKEDPRVCASVQTIEIDQEQLASLCRVVQERSDTMLAAMEQVLKSPRWRKTNASGRRVRVSWTCYLSEDALEEDVSSKERNVMRRRPSRLPLRAAARKVGRKAGW